MLQVRWVWRLLVKLDTCIRQISSGKGGMVGQIIFIWLVRDKEGGCMMVFCGRLVVCIMLDTCTLAVSSRGKGRIVYNGLVGGRTSRDGWGWTMAAGGRGGSGVGKVVQ